MRKIFALLLSILIIGCQSEKIKTIVIQPDGNNMVYLTKSFNVKKNQSVKVIMDNTATVEVMKHNVVILSDESKVSEVGLQALSAKDYLPNHPAIIAATPMAEPGKKTEVTFTAPSEPGNYVFICTYPGHYNLMKGIMIVE